MHEYALAEAIARRVEAEAQRVGACRVTALDVEIGALARVEPEALAWWLREELGAAAGADTRIRVRTAPLVIGCGRCGYRWALAKDDDLLPWPEPSSWYCARCGSDEVTVDGNGGCRVGRLRFAP